jgi:hypothetical protein
MRDEHAGDGPAAMHHRRKVSEHEGQPKRHGADHEQRAITEAVMLPVDQDSGDEIGDPVPDRRDHVRRRRDGDRQLKRVRVVEQQEEHDALPEKVEGEVAEREQQ